jgi:hypothetical protein
VPEDQSWWDFILRSCLYGELHRESHLDMPADGNVVSMRRMRRNSWRSSSPVDGMTVLIFGDARMFCIEGRLAPFATGDLQARGLARPKQLIEIESAAQQAVERIGFPVIDREIRPVLRRLDLATDLAFSDGTQGLEFLAATGETFLAGHKTLRWSASGRTETVSYLRDAKSQDMTARTYDRGVKAETHQPGELVRLEAQLRWPKPGQTPVSSLQVETLPDLAMDPFESADSGISSYRADVPDELAARASWLIGMTERGMLSREAAFRLIGSLYVFGRKDKRWWLQHASSATRRKHERELSAALDDYEPAEPTNPGPQRSSLLLQAREAWKEVCSS